MRQLSILIAKARIRGFLDDVSGIAAVEFAYIAPLLMLMTFGTFEISRALIVNKRFQRATAMVGDLVSREEQLGATYPEAKAALDGIMLSAQHVMEPYTSTPFRIAITQLRASSSDPKNTNVEWSYSYNGMPVTKCPLAKNMPAWNMITKGNAAIVVEAQYQYTPLLTNIIPNLIKQMNWSDTMAFSPRYGSVFYGQAMQNTVCPT